jgi:predicted adenylyl cyclase CyaB
VERGGQIKNHQSKIINQKSSINNLKSHILNHQSSFMFLNIELKARCPDLAPLRAKLRAAGADFRGTDKQTDVYFRVPHGRLKLRRGPIENHLIHYFRADQAGAKASEVQLYDTSRDPEVLEELLRTALGERVTVRKEREIYYIGNVKFHLDRVAELGTFVEIEAIDRDGSIGRAELARQCAHYQAYLGIDPADLLTHSYSDMLLARAND